MNTDKAASLKAKLDVERAQANTAFEASLKTHRQEAHRTFDNATAAAEDKFRDGMRKLEAEEAAGKKDDAFKAAALPLIKWLCENENPHQVVIVSPTSAELLQMTRCTGQILDYVRG